MLDGGAGRQAGRQADEEPTVGPMLLPYIDGAGS